MRRQIQEIKSTRRSDEALAPSAVDAAFADETIGALPAADARRELAAFAFSAAHIRRTVDKAHRTLDSEPRHGSAEGKLLQSLADQISVLQAEQAQIQRLLKRAYGDAHAPA